MKLTFRTIKGSTFNVEAEPTTTVGELKSAVESSQGEAFPKEQLKLVYKGKVLDDDVKAVSEYSVDETGFLVVFVQKAVAKPAAAAATGAAGASSSAPAPAAEPSAMQVDAPAAAATPAAAAAPAEPAAAAAEPADPYSAAASHLLAGTALEQAVSNMTEMGFPREDVMRAMRAAYNNPERAVEYLMTGIPEHAAHRAAGPGAAAAGGAAVGAAGGGGAAPAAAAAAGGAAGPPAPQAFDMFGGGGDGGGAAGGAGAAAGGGAGGEAGPLDFLRGNAQFQLLRRAVQANPDILAPMLQELRKQNPALMQQISAHQQEFMAMVQAPPEGEDEEVVQMAQLLGAMGGGAAGGLPPGVVQIELTEDDDAAIQRLQGLGFERDACIEAYLACDKNEEVAANFLLEGGFGGDE